MAVIDTLDVKLRADVSEFEREIHRGRDAMGRFRSESNALDKALEATGDAAQSLGDTFMAIGYTIGTVGAAAVGTTGAMTILGIGLRQGGKATAESGVANKALAATMIASGGLVGAIGTTITVAGLAIGAFKLMANAAIEGIPQIQALEDAHHRLAAVFGDTAQAGAAMATSQQLIANINESQPFFSKDQLVNATATLRMYGATAQEISQLLPLLTSMAAVMGTNLGEAAQKVGLGLVGTTRGLKEWGIVIAEGSSRQTIFNAVVDASARFHGEAAIKADQHAGKVQAIDKALKEANRSLASLMFPPMAWKDSAVLSAAEAARTLAQAIELVHTSIWKSNQEAAKAPPGLFGTTAFGPTKRIPFKLPEKLTTPIIPEGSVGDVPVPGMPEATGFRLDKGKITTLWKPADPARIQSNMMQRLALSDIQADTEIQQLQGRIKIVKETLAATKTIFTADARRELENQVTLWNVSLAKALKAPKEVKTEAPTPRLDPGKWAAMEEVRLQKELQRSLELATMDGIEREKQLAYHAHLDRIARANNNKDLITASRLQLWYDQHAIDEREGKVAAAKDEKLATERLEIAQKYREKMDERLFARSMTAATIATGEATAMTRFTADPETRLAQEMRIRRQAIDDEYALRMERSTSLLSDEGAKSLEIAQDADDFRSGALDKLLSDERVGRRQIEEEMGQLRISQLKDAISLAADLAVKGIRGEQISMGDVVRGGGGLAGGVVGAAFGSPQTGAFIGDILGKLGGELLDKQAEKERLERETARENMAAAMKMLRAAEEQNKAAKLAIIASGKDLDQQILNARDMVAVSTGALDKSDAEKRRIDREYAEKIAQEAAGNKVAEEFIGPKKYRVASGMDASFLNIKPGEIGPPPKYEDPYSNITKFPVHPGIGADIAITPSATPGAPGYVGPPPTQDLNESYRTGKTGVGYKTPSFAEQASMTPLIAGEKMIGAVEQGTLKGENINKLEELRDLLKQLVGINESRGTERNPLITAPTRTSKFDFAPRSFFLRARGGGTTRGQVTFGQGGAAPAPRIRALG